MADTDSGGAKAIRDLSRRLKDYAAEVGHDPERQFDIRQAAKLLLQPEKLTMKLTQPAKVQLSSGRRPARL
jgi:hypothetical protein